MAGKIGAPSIYTQELADAICDLLASGMSMRSVAKKEGMPSCQTMFKWIREKPEFAEQYARAKQECADALVEEMQDIADDASNDWMEREDPKNPGYDFNGEHVQRSRLRIDTRKWIASKLKPKKYGEKLDLTTNGKELPAPILGGISVHPDKCNHETPEAEKAD